MEYLVLWEGRYTAPSLHSWIWLHNGSNLLLFMSKHSDWLSKETQEAVCYQMQKQGYGIDTSLRFFSFNINFGNALIWNALSQSHSGLVEANRQTKDKISPQHFLLQGFAIIASQGFRLRQCHAENFQHSVDWLPIKQPSGVFMQATKFVSKGRCYQLAGRRQRGRPK